MSDAQQTVPIPIPPNPTPASLTPPPASGPVDRSRRTALIVLVVAATLLLGTVAAAVATHGFAATRTAATGAGVPGGYAGNTGGATTSGPVWLTGDGTAVTSIDAARRRASQAASAAGLHPGEIIWFDNGFYVELKDGAGQPATEVIVDPTTGAVTTEPGPAMMWNTRYGMMRGTYGRNDNGYNGNGMMGGYDGGGYGDGMMGGQGMMGGHGWTPPNGQATAAVTADQARAIARQWLAANRAGQNAETPDTYPGYYTIETTTSGTITGMLSVNAGTGAVWYHTWHGRYLAKVDN